MSWIRRTEVIAGHRCEPPMREAVYTLPPMPPPARDARGWKPEPPRRWHTTVVDGECGDLWRCDACGVLWRIGNACDLCDPAPPRGICRSGRIYHAPAAAWRHASWWQRLRHR